MTLNKYTAKIDIILLKQNIIYVLLNIIKTAVSIIKSSISSWMIRSEIPDKLSLF